MIDAELQRIKRYARSHWDTPSCDVDDLLLYIDQLKTKLAEREAEVERLRSDNAEAWKMANKYREQGA